jgi:hypothetical protein
LPKEIKENLAKIIESIKSLDKKEIEGLKSEVERVKTEQNIDKKPQKEPLLQKETKPHESANKTATQNEQILNQNDKIEAKSHESINKTTILEEKLESKPNESVKNVAKKEQNQILNEKQVIDNKIQAKNEIKTQLQESKNTQTQTTDELENIFQKVEQNSKAAQKTIIKLTNLTQLLEKSVPKEVEKSIINESFKKEANEILKELKSDISSLKESPKFLKLTQNIDFSPIQKKEIVEDLKATLLKLDKDIDESLKEAPNKSFHEAKQVVSKLTTQIEYFQINSYLNNSNQLFLPYLWDGLGEGRVSFKKDESDRFICQIDLNFQEYGELNISLILFQKDKLDIYIKAQKPELSNKIKANLKTLRSLMLAQNLRPMNIFVLQKENSSQNSKKINSYQPFISKGSIDIKT